MKRKQKNEDIDNKFEFGAFVIEHWWKVILLLLVAGLMVSGFTIQCGKNSIHKDPLKIKTPQVQSNE